MKYTWKMTGVPVVDALGKQLQKVVRSMNESKIETRYRYVGAAERFLNFIGKKYKVNKIANISDKHLKAYAEHLKSNGKADKYIKVELSGIRYLHNKIENTKHELRDAAVFNREIGLTKTPDGRADRAWTEKEFQGLKEIAIKNNQYEIAKVLEGIKNTGMRLDEACTIRKEDIGIALDTGVLHLHNTKGGVPRDVSISPEARKMFESLIKDLKKGEYVYTPRKFVEAREIHKFERKTQNFIYWHRDKVQEKDRKQTGHNVVKGERSALTIHGLRHMYARERYLKELEKGISKGMARINVAAELGHGRDSVTYIYLGGVGND